MKIDYLAVQPAQYAATAKVVQQAFASAAHSDHDEHNLIGRLRKTPTYQPTFDVLAATSAGEIVGHVMLSKATVTTQPTAAPGIAVLAPLAVLPAYQGQGIGGQLLRTVEQRAVAVGVPAISILGDPAYYGRFGYRPASQFGITAPMAIPAAYFMLRELTPGALAAYQGELHYDPAFGIA
ncbi:GNAT family N-acetyltransferase [Lactiplantibacillus daowaiensis]|uniref:GNAT family N-acetyltransferase n=1 Tax=Lactiplantibacillus daowaiensis TaxID=2559918 RepID=A0ABW1RXK2_9LACO|nr:N-acetyltransferase [Lactiplantibacillus daowaiensis]